MFVKKLGECASIRPELLNMSRAEYCEESGKKLKAIMKAKDINYRKLAACTGLGFCTIANYARGKSIPSLYALHLIAEALECSVDDFTV